MELRKRNKLDRKKIFLVVSVVLLTILTIGFAYIQARLDVGVKVRIANGMWDVHFENLSIDSGSATAIKSATISSDRRKITFSVKLTSKTDYYQFETDIVNSGELDAMVSDAKISGLPDNLKAFMEYTLTYADDVEIKPNDLLAIGSTERIKVRLSFKEGVDLTNLPEVDDFDLVLSIPYIQATDAAVEREKDESSRKIQLLGIDMIAYMDNVKSEFVSAETGVDFSAISSDSNGKGLYVRAGTEVKTDTYSGEPIYYYRGAVTNNNVIFAGFCWKIVRTTETSGTKLIYNGAASTTSTCKDVRESAAFSSPSSPSVGYTTGTSNTSSAIKNVIDNWYKSNILNEYESYLEDTIWCNDRSVYSKSGSKIYYGAYGRLSASKKPSLECPQQADKYTLKSTASNYNAKLNGNKLLDYPIALLTADEVSLAGGVYGLSNGTYYLRPSLHFWLMSPDYYDGSNYYIFVMYETGYLNNSKSSLYVRPSISLKAGTKASGGDGTSNNPYIVS